MATVLEGPSQLSVGDNGLPPESVIFGRSLAMQEVRRKIGRLASANVPVLVQGESGTGKEIIAQLIHRLSPWADGPLVKINCPAIPGSLLESELFGYEKGAFTGAYGTKPGRVEMAHRGTLFLDEIGELAPGLQAKLLQLLQDGQFCRIGAQEDKKVEVRVVCATNRDLDREVQEGRFRQDLFFRINVLSVRLPPLRERIEDVEGIVDYFLEFYRHKYNGGSQRFVSAHDSNSRKPQLARKHPRTGKRDQAVCNFWVRRCHHYGPVAGPWQADGVEIGRRRDRTPQASHTAGGSGAGQQDYP